VQCKHVCQSAVITRHGGVHGIVAAVARRMNEVTLRRAWLVLGWVTIFGRVYHAAASGPKFTMLWERVEAILLLNKIFFPIVDTCLSCKDIDRQSCAMMPIWRSFEDFLRPVFAASAVQTFQTCILNSH